jgi:hypothetical protein
MAFSSVSVQCFVCSPQDGHGAVEDIRLPYDVVLVAVAGELKAHCPAVVLHIADAVIASVVLVMHSNHMKATEQDAGVAGFYFS